MPQRAEQRYTCRSGRKSQDTPSSIKTVPISLKKSLVLSSLPSPRFMDLHAKSQQSITVPVTAKEFPCPTQVHKVLGYPSLTWQWSCLHQRKQQGWQSQSLMNAPCFSQIQSPVASLGDCTCSPRAWHPGLTEHLQRESSAGTGYAAGSGTGTRGAHTDNPGSQALSLHHDTVHCWDPPC